MSNAERSVRSRKADRLQWPEVRGQSAPSATVAECPAPTIDSHYHRATGAQWKQTNSNESERNRTKARYWWQWPLTKVGHISRFIRQYRATKGAQKFETKSYSGFWFRLALWCRSSSGVLLVFSTKLCVSYNVARVIGLVVKCSDCSSPTSARWESLGNQTFQKSISERCLWNLNWYRRNFSL